MARVGAPRQRHPDLVFDPPDAAIPVVHARKKLQRAESEGYAQRQSVHPDGGPPDRIDAPGGYLPELVLRPRAHRGVRAQALPQSLRCLGVDQEPSRVREGIRVERRRNALRRRPDPA